MRKKYPEGSPVDLIMKVFCDIVMPGHQRKPGYINVKKITEGLEISRRTYYNWKRSEAAPPLEKFINMLDERGYALHIVKKDSQY